MVGDDQQRACDASRRAPRRGCPKRAACAPTSAHVGHALRRRDEGEPQRADQRAAHGLPRRGREPPERAREPHPRWASVATWPPTSVATPGPAARSRRTACAFAWLRSAAGDRPVRGRVEQAQVGHAALDEPAGARAQRAERFAQHRHRPLRHGGERLRQRQAAVGAPLERQPRAAAPARWRPARPRRRAGSWRPRRPACGR